MADLPLPAPALLTPETDNLALKVLDEDEVRGYKLEAIVKLATLSRKLEKERDEERAAVEMLTQHLIERQESFQQQLIRIETTWREKLAASLKELYSY